MQRVFSIKEYPYGPEELDGYRDKSKENTQIIVNVNIDTSLFNISPGRYEMIKKFMYLFSPVELQQKCAELYEYVNNMTKEEIFDKDDSLRNINHMTKVIFSKTADVHLWYMMKECAEDAGMWFDFGNYDMILLTAFYFKYYNIYKTSDSLSKTYIDTVINKSNTDETVMKLYSRHFIKWLNEQLEQQMRKLYTVIQYNFYKRFYEWSDINHYGVGLADRISEGFIEQLNEKYGDRKIPLLNKEIDY